MAFQDNATDPDQELASAHDKDLRMLHSKEMMLHSKEDIAGHRDRIGDTQAQELDNLKGRQEVEALKLAKALRQERGRGAGEGRADDPARNDLSARVRARIREAKKRDEQQRHAKDRDQGRERD